MNRSSTMWFRLENTMLTFNKHMQRERAHAHESGTNSKKCNNTIKKAIKNNTRYAKQMNGIAFMCAPVAFASLHWVAAQTYAYYCAPSGFYGYIVTFFNMANPVCSYTLQVLDTSKYFYNQSWIFIGITTLGACKHVYEKHTATAK